MTVPVFEEQIRQGLLLEKFRKLVTDGISVGPGELQDEFKNRNEKVKLDYVLKSSPKNWRRNSNPSEAGNQGCLRKEQGQVPRAGEACGALRAG